jgi:prepilin-type N-terminal cleavage/methylation domain-containing protein/prepilin-type processing-associated H-X9-DG protein
MRTRNKSFAFTLIELLVVVSIISLLIAILVPSLQRAKLQAKNTLCLNNLRGVYAALMMYAETNKRIPPLNNEPDEGSWQYNYIIFDGRDFDQNFGPLLRPEGPIAQVEQFYCPFQEDPFHSLNTEVNPWPHQANVDTRAGYSRRFGMSGKSFSEFLEIKALIADLMHVPKYIESAHKDGVNVAYTDGHVIWVPATDDLLDNELSTPFDPMDNPIVEDIWKELDEKGR